MSGDIMPQAYLPNHLMYRTAEGCDLSFNSAVAT